MASEIEEEIAQAAKDLLVNKHVKRLTVKDIVEACQITRQTFYYHFEDIPALFRWMFERDSARTLLEVRSLHGGEEQLRYLFVMGLNALPYVKKGMSGNYRDELESYLSQYIQRLFGQICDEEGLYQDCTRFEVKLILRYHSQAILGLSATGRRTTPKIWIKLSTRYFAFSPREFPQGKKTPKRSSSNTNCTKEPKCFLHFGSFVYTLFIL